MDPIRCAVLYARVREQASSQELLQVQDELGQAVAYARRHGLRVLDTFVDRFGTRRTPRPELAKAIRLCADFSASLIIPRMGKMAADPSFYEQVHMAGVDLVVLQDRQLTQDSLVRHGLKALRCEQRQADGEAPQTDAA